MCDPMTIASTALSTVMSVAGSVMQYSQQQAQSKAVAKSAVASMTDGYAALGLRQAQEGRKAAEERVNAQVEKQKAVSTATVAAGEAGAGGVSFNALLGEYEGRYGRYSSTVAANADMISDQLQAEKKGLQTQAQSRINSAPAPSTLGLIGNIGLGLAEGAMDLYDTGELDGLLETTDTPKRRRGGAGSSSINFT